MPPKPAPFVPFPTQFSVKELVEQNPSFEFAPRISCQKLDHQSREDFEHLIRLQLANIGVPMVIEGFDEYIDKRLFSRAWLQKSERRECARDLVARKDVPMTVAHYVKNLPKLTRQYFSATTHSQQRLYLKDIDCPAEWQKSLEDLIPPSLFYMNEKPKPYNGPGSRSRHHDPEYLTTKDGRLIAKSGDLMSCLPEEMRAQNLMCYIGHEGTYTAAHQEMCASLGQNLMVEASDGSVENGERSQPGSSVWFMTKTKDRHAVAEYWTSVLGHDIDLEDHFAQINAWKGAPFKTYIVEQKPGDLILVPPLAAHQVWNRGTRTVKVAWNRITVETLKLAMSEALPKARIVCRDEQYKNKAIVFHALEYYSELLKDLPTTEHPATRTLWRDFENLLSLYTDILISESLSRSYATSRNIAKIPFEGNVTCSYCRCNIFNRFLTCPNCVSDADDKYDICMDCYVLGRSCLCISKLTFVEQFKWEFLRSRHDRWRRQVIDLKKGDSERKNEFPALHVARAQFNRKPVAEICQEQLKNRPWVDIHSLTPPSSKSGSITPSDDDNPQPRKRRKSKQSKNANKKTGTCHMCQNKQPDWKLAECSRCRLKYCYASLFAAFDVTPEEAMGESAWLCPRCHKICNCMPCQGDPSMRPHEPNHISLELDTIKVADPRSVESLVNMRISNEKWIPNLGAMIGERLNQRRDEENHRREEVWRTNGIISGPEFQTPQRENGFLDCIDPSLSLDSSLMGPVPESTYT
ncbi:hypothetical protein N7456_002096 [Penicillium angulare]|uniref:JmjC domain-containing protein n=1 Tax=Penicillium angulare TaxID=116970 RepID=A0A9W9G7R1_9EURO|nr:hypothetical protein N7456_002096 [Penicillium angulare]